MNIKSFVLCALLLFCPSLSMAEVNWLSWKTYTPAVLGQPATVTGVAPQLTATFTGPLTLPPQLNNVGVPYWAHTPTSFKALPPVENSPPTADVIRLTTAGTYTLTFAQPVTNPVMAILSLGGLDGAVTLDFLTQPVTLLSTGTGFFGGNTLLSIIGNTVGGKEVNGLVQFPGTMTTLTFTMNPGENWSGVTVGIPVVVTPVPVSQITIGLEWNAPSVAKNLDGSTMVITGYNVYHGLSEEACTSPAPLQVLAGTVGPVLTFEEDIPAVVGPICYEATTLANTEESAHSTRAHAQVGAPLPLSPTTLRITIGVP